MKLARVVQVLWSQIIIQFLWHAKWVKINSGGVFKNYWWNIHATKVWKLKKYIVKSQVHKNDGAPAENDFFKVVPVSKVGIERDLFDNLQSQSKD